MYSGCATPTPPPEPTTSTCPQLSSYQTTCGIIRDNSSAACAIVMGPDATNYYYKACILDSCLGNSNPLAPCHVIKTFFEECARRGVAVNCATWQTASGCGESCTSNKHLRFMCENLDCVNSALTVCSTLCESDRYSENLMFAQWIQRMQASCHITCYGIENSPNFQ